MAAGGGSGADTDAGPRICTSCGACEQALGQQMFTHRLDAIEYPDPPPAGGDHDPCWARWGVHTEAVPARNWVHNLEHGGVVFLHNCEAPCDAELEAFTAIARANMRTLLTPYPDLPSRFALVSWGHRIVSDCVDDEAFQAFYDEHWNRGLESIGADPPAGCR